MIKPAIAFLLGCLLIAWLPSLPSVYWLLMLLPLVIVVRRSSNTAVLWCIAAIVWSGLQAHSRLDNRLDPELEGQDILVAGFIDSLPHQTDQRLRFEFRPDAKHTNLPSKIRLSWYFPPDIKPNAGEKWQLLVRLKSPRGMANPGGFDYESWLFQQRIGATGYIRSSDSNQLLLEASGLSVNHWRAALLEKLNRALIDSPHLPLIQGLAVGNRDDMQSYQWDTLRQTGTSHLLAISGLHIGLAAALGFFISRMLWRLRSRQLLLLTDKQAGAIGGMILATFYALLAGLSIPTQRALVMVIVIMFSIFIKRRVAPIQVLSVSLILVLIMDPFAVLSAGFWLSFTAVACILYIAQYRHPPGKYLWLHIHFWIAAGLTPLLLLFFQETSFIAPLANLLAVPLVSLIIVPLLLLSMLLLNLNITIASWTLQLTNQLLAWLWAFLDYLAQLPFSIWQPPTIPISLLALLLTGIVLLLAPRGWPLRWLSIVFMLPILFFTPKHPEPAEIWFTLLDVGQGLSAVIQTHQHTLVFDAGPAFGEFDTGAAVVVPFLRHQGIKSVDTLLISHGDNDHIGGAKSVLKALPVKQVLSSDTKQLPNSKLCREGQSWEWDEVQFQILHPTVGQNGSRNDSSCVLHISSRYGTILLTGDIEHRAEISLTRRHADKLKADVLVAPHHGSRSSSSTVFVEQVFPKFVLFASGYQNRYHFPAPEVVSRYQAIGSEHYQTGIQGALSIRIDHQQDLTPFSWREQYRRIWMRNATE